MFENYGVPILLDSSETMDLVLIIERTGFFLLFLNEVDFLEIFDDAFQSNIIMSRTTRIAPTIRPIVISNFICIMYMKFR